MVLAGGHRKLIRIRGQSSGPPVDPRVTATWCWWPLGRVRQATFMKAPCGHRRHGRGASRRDLGPAV